MKITWSEIAEDIIYNNLLGLESNGTHYTISHILTTLFPLPLKINTKVYHKDTFLYYYDPEYEIYVNPMTVTNLINTNKIPVMRKLEIFKEYIQTYTKIHITYIDDDSFLI